VEGPDNEARRGCTGGGEAAGIRQLIKTFD